MRFICSIAITAYTGVFCGVDEKSVWSTKGVAAVHQPHPMAAHHTCIELAPPPPPARRMKSFFRSSPYGGECFSLVCWPVAVCNVAMRSAIGFFLGSMSAVNSDGEDYGQVELVLHFNSVEKIFAVPGQHMQELLDVYSLLQTLKLTGAIQCATLHVSIHLEQHLNNI